MRRLQLMAKAGLLAGMGAVVLSPAVAQQNVPRVQSPAILTVLAQEVHSPHAANRVNDTAYDPVSAAIGSLNLNPSDWTAGQKAAVEFSISLASARQRADSAIATYRSRLDGAEFVGRLAVGGTAAAALVPGAQPLAVTFGVGLVMATEMNTAYRRAEFDAAAANIRESFMADVDDLAKLAIGQANLGQGADSRTARQFVDDFMASPQFQSLDAQSKAAVQGHLQDRVTAMLEKGQTVTSSQVASLQANSAKLMDSIAATQADVSKLERNLSARLDASEKILLATNTGLENLRARQEESFTQMQYLSWSQLPPRKQLELLRDPGFLPNMAGRDEIRQNLQVTVFAQDTAKYAGAVGNMASILNDLGLPLNIASLNQGLNFVTSGVSSYAAFATGDFTGGIASLSKLVGGLRGKPDAAQQRHQQIMAKLEQIVRLQRQTLVKLDELSSQLHVSTEAILRSAADNQELSALALRGVEGLGWGDAFNRCRAFHSIPRIDKRLNENGLFLTYKDRVAHYQANPDSYSACGAVLRTLGQLKQTDVGGKSHLHRGLWGYETTDGPQAETKSPWHYQRMWYEPMLALTRHVYFSSVAGPRPSGCPNGLLGVLAATPPTLHEVYSLVDPCLPVVAQPGDAPTATSQLRSRIIPDVTFDGAVGLVAHPGRVAEVANLMMFWLPFKELERTPAKGKIHGTLHSAKQLETASIGSLRAQHAQTYTLMSEVVTVALAQQTVLSGAMVAAWSADVLRRGNYGFAFKDAEARRQPRRDAIAALLPGGVGPMWTSPIGSTPDIVPQEFGAIALSTAQTNAIRTLRDSYEKAYLQEVSAFKSKDRFCPASTQLATNDVAAQASVVVCLMDAHPAFARNVALILFSDAVRAGNRDLDVVARWLREESYDTLQDALPGLPLLRTGPRGQPPAWGIRLLHPDGREIFLPSPSIPEMEQASVAYPPAAYPLMQAREALLDRAASLDSSVGLPPPNLRSAQANVQRAAWMRQKSMVRAPAGLTAVN